MDITSKVENSGTFLRWFIAASLTGIEITKEDVIANIKAMEKKGGSIMSMPIFHQVHLGKPMGAIQDIVRAGREVLESTGIRTAVFEFNGKQVYINTETEDSYCQLVLKAIQNPKSKEIVDIRG